MRRALMMVAWTVAMLVGLMIAERRVDACSCMSPRIRVLPEASGVAPTNTHVWIELPPGEPVLFKGRKPPMSAHAKATFEVRIAGGDVVDVKTRRDLSSGSMHYVELVPKSDLRANASYEVVMYEANKPRTIGRFTTGKLRDTTPPRTKLLKATYEHPPAVCCNCSTGSPYVRFKIEDKSKIPAVVYGVWMVPATQARVDFSIPPAAYVRPWYGTVTIGHPSTCSPSNFTLPAGATAYRFGLMAMDVAGNQGMPMEVHVKSHSPGSKRPGRRP